jgi:arylsulfatase A-like enzyme
MTERRARRLAALLLLAAACARAPQGPRHVLLIVLDATHGAQLSCQGGPAGLTPGLDALAARGTRFSRAFSNAAWTLPSTASLHTGRLPERHGVLTNHHALPDEAVTLAERMAAADRRTAAFVQMVYASEAHGLQQGFADWHYYPVSLERREESLLEDLSAWRTAHAQEPTFAYVHLRRPHSPYDPPVEVLQRTGVPPLPADAARREALMQADSALVETGALRAGELEVVRALYRGNLAAIDVRLAPLLQDALARSDTLVLVTSDHGDAMGQHGVIGHGATVWAETLDIPLLAAGPGVAAGRVDDGPACTVDLAPTLAEWCGLPTDGARLDGRSLAARLRGEAAAEAPRGPLPVAARYTLPGVEPALAVFEGRLKLVLQPDGAHALFDRLDDRGDDFDVSAAHPDVARRLLDFALDWRARHRNAVLQGLPAPAPDEQRLRDLQQLGYAR